MPLTVCRVPAVIFSGIMFFGTLVFGGLPGEKNPPPVTPASLLDIGRLAVEPSAAQRIAAQELTGADIFWDPETGVPGSIRAEKLAAQNLGGKGLPLKAGPAYAENALAVMDRLSALYRLKDAQAEFSVDRVDDDILGYHHARLEQRHRGLKVFGGEILVHFNAEDAAYQVNGRYVPEIDLAVEPRLTPADAIAAAQADLAARGKPGGALARKPELLIYAWNTAPTLAYELTIVRGIAEDWRYWVDALSGRIVNHFNDAATAWNDQVPVSISGNLLPGEGAASNDVMGMSVELYFDEPVIYYYLYSTNPPYADWYIHNSATNGYEDTNSCARRTSPSWGSSDSTEYSAAYNFNIVMNYFHDVHGRDSFDNMNHQALVYVHVPSGVDNCGYMPSDDYFFFYPGSNNAEMTVLDLCGHEFTHAVNKAMTHYTYQGEAGAIAESFCDIFGTAIEFSAQPYTNVYPNRIAGRADWLIAEDAAYPTADGAWRDMRNPQRIFQPSYYLGTNWYPTTNSGDNGGVHINSGVQNFFFYLLSNGDAGTNDGHAYRVTGIGITNAAKVAFRVLSAYASYVYGYSGTDSGWKSAAQDLNTNWVTSVQAAWAAVGIGEAPPQPPPTPPAGNLPVSQDFDGDGKADPAIYNSSLSLAGSGEEGDWHIWLSQNGYIRLDLASLTGASGTPVAGDFDGDGKADPAVYDASGNWHIWLSQNGYARLDLASLTGASGTPVAGDFDGDSKADPAVYGASGNWHVWLSQNAYARLDVASLTGAAGTPLAADFDGDGKADPAVYDASGNWHVWLSQNGYARMDVASLTGAAGTPLAADFDHDGKADPAVYDASCNWHIWLSQNGYARLDVTTLTLP